ncbi:phage tail protein [Grimontia sp. AD028]|uniref:Phage tail protein n=1 Tax=Grimontia sedimenti TaxID=2711294 RepID=A0A6M1R819_9GAMM|nr:MULTISPECIES: phage tail protein [Grimontia]KKD61735.1 phage tail protein [Grimontia sp. AD028]NGN96266.1 phage tail protein [Grimontia sedimenti]WRV99796.1 phage tail protein [Grimontia sp. NTOU-MAR1]
MSQLNVNGQRVVPYPGYKFIIKEAGGDVLAAVQKVSGLSRTVEVNEYRAGGDPSHTRKSPGQVKFEAITLERGVTENLQFEQWANKVWRIGTEPGGEVSLADLHKNLILEVLNEAGQKVLSYSIYRCWVSEYKALPGLDASSSAFMIQSIKLENEGWERMAVTTPKEPSFVHPEQ